MDAPLYIDVLERTLLPFIESVYLEGYHFMADNDPKHASKQAMDFFDEKDVNWWRTSAQLPNCNPIKNLWHELKESSCCETYNNRTIDWQDKGILEDSNCN